MNLKKSALLTTLGTAGILSGMAWLSQGCYMVSDECVCTTDFRYHQVVVLDELSQPVDSASVRIYRVSDNKEITSADQDKGLREKGKVVVFSDGYASEFPEGRSRLEIRAVVSKGARTGEERYVFSQDECGCHFEKVSGRDTIGIR